MEFDTLDELTTHFSGKVRDLSFSAAIKDTYRTLAVHVMQSSCFFTLYGEDPDALRVAHEAKAFLLTKRRVIPELFGAPAAILTACRSVSFVSDVIPGRHHEWGDKTLVATPCAQLASVTTYDEDRRFDTCDQRVSKYRPGSASACIRDEHLHRFS